MITQFEDQKTQWRYGTVCAIVAWLVMILFVILAAQGCRTMTVYVGSQHNDAAGGDSGATITATQTDTGNSNTVTTDGMMGKSTGVDPEISPLRNVADNQIQAPVSQAGNAASSGDQSRGPELGEGTSPSPKPSPDEIAPSSGEGEISQGESEGETLPQPPEATLPPGT